MELICDRNKTFKRFLITASFNDFIIDIIQGRYEYLYLNGHKFNKYYLN